MINRIVYILLLVCLTSLYSCTKKKDPTYCNPIDLNYGWGAFHQKNLNRASADPVVVLFKDKYYLFSTHDIGGYRVSDDLVNWKDIAFDEAIQHAVHDNNHRYVAPAVAADDNYIYFIRLNKIRDSETCPVIRTSDPESGKWEVCGHIRKVQDPTLFIDNERFFIYHGLGAHQSIRCFEVDPSTFEEIPDSERLLLPVIKDVHETGAGYHLGRRELYDEIDAREWVDKFQWIPCPEGAWIVKNNNKYYLQFATPGTTSIWYSDIVMESDSPDGPFTISPYNPASLKVGGFIGSAGHSSVFKDRYDNWWEMTTMWIGNSDLFERRLGLFPVSFDSQGRMKVHTRFGDYPMKVPQRKFDPETESSLLGLNLLSYNRECTASSVLDSCDVSLGSDENIRTWWSAKTGNAGEWFCMNLGQEARIDAIQINFAEQDIDTTRVNEDDYTAYTIYTSLDSIQWNKVVDKSKNRITNPHDYIELKKSVRAKYVKVVNEQAMSGGKFAIRDLRLFGQGSGEVPDSVTEASAKRNRDDERFSFVKWNRIEDADGYLVCFGYSPDYLNLTVQVKGNETTDLFLHILTKEIPYYYRIDTYNSNGVTKGKVFGED